MRYDDETLQDPTTVGGATGTRPFEVPSTPPLSKYTPPPAPPVRPPSKYTDPVVADRLETALRPDTPTPAEAARIYRLQTRTGLPLDVIRRHVDQIEQDTARADFNAATYRQSSPLLAAWLASDEYHAALAHDDITPLSTIETLAGVGRRLLGAAAAGPVRFVQGALDQMAAESRGLADLPPWLTRALPPTAKAFVDARQLVAPAQAAAATRGADALHAIAETLAGDRARAGGFEAAVEGGLEGIGALAPALAGGALFGTPALLATVATSTSGEATRAAQAEGFTSTEALGYGAVQGAIAAGTMALPAKYFLRDWQLRVPVVQAMLDVALPGVGGAVAQQTLADLASWQLLPSNAEKTFGDWLAERPSATGSAIVAGLVGLGGATLLTHGSARVLRQLGVAAQSSTLVGRSPEKAAAFIDHVASDGPMARVGLPIDEFTTYFQETDASPRDVATRLTGDPEAFTRATQTGEDLAVPLGRYLTELGRDARHSAFWAEHARFDPTVPTAAELARNEAAAGAAADRLSETARATPTSAAAAVGESFRGELEREGFAPETARAYGAVQQAVFGTLGARTGRDPVALYDRYRLTVRRSLLGGPEVPRPAKIPDAMRPLYDALVTDAKAQGFRGREATLRQRFAAKLTEAQSIARDLADGESTGPTSFDLLEAVSRAGGVGLEAESASGMRGELRVLLESLNRSQNVIRRGARAGEVLPAEFRRSGGVPGAPGVIQRAGGASLDTIREAVNEDPRWAGQFEHLPDFLEALRGAVQAETSDTSTTTAASPAALEGILANVLQVKAGVPWFDAGGGVQRFFARAGRRVLGQISFGRDRQFSIDLFSGARLGTLLHETSHFWTEVLGDLTDELRAKDATALSPAERRVLEDYDALLHWAGATSRADLGEAGHEQIARGFEAYVMEGRAPAPALQPTFARMRAWLVSVYRSVRNLRVSLTPEIRGVFDRLLATDDAIAKAERDAGVTVPFLTDELAALAGLSDAEKADYQRALEAAMSTARDTVQAQLLADLKREHETWWREARARVRDSLAPTVAREPVYQALRFLQHGLDGQGEPVPEGAAFKLDADALRREYGPEILAQLPRPVVYADGGMPLAAAAEVLGFGFGRELVDALRTAPSFERALDAAADAAMKARHGDRLTDGTLAADAAKAVVASRADVFAAELALLERLVHRTTGIAPPPSTPPATIRGIAERRIAATPIGELRAGVFTAAAKRAAREAIVAAGKQDFRAALAAKQRQFLSAELARAVETARTETIDPVLADARKPWTPGRVATRTNPDLDAARQALFVQFGMKRADPAIENVWTYLEKVKAYDAPLFADLQAAIDAAAQAPRPYRQLTVDEFTSLKDAIDNLDYLARRSREVEIDGQRMGLEAAVGRLTTQLSTFGGGRRPRARGRSATAGEKLSVGLLGWRAALRRVESWAEAIDGGDAGGAFTRLIWNPVSEASSRFRVAKRDLLPRYAEIVKAVAPALTHDPIEAPELAYTFRDKGELLHALLNVGNESNLRKLLLGESEGRPAWGSLKGAGRAGSTAELLDTSRFDAFLQRMHRDGVLGKADWDYVQGTLDLVETLKADAQRAHHARYGYYFPEVEARAIVTPFGRYRGGYFPVKYDPWLRDDVARHGEQAALEATANAVQWPSTGRGFTKGRVEAFARPIMLDWHVIPEHLDAVLRFTHLAPAVNDVARIVMDDTFARALHASDPAAHGDLLVPWLQRSARQLIEQPAQGAAGRLAARVFRTLRTRTGLGAIAGNALNALQQAPGLFVSTLKAPPGALARGLWDYVRAPKQVSAAIAEKSAFMATRELTQTMEIHRTLTDLLDNPSRYAKLQAYTQQHGYVFSAAVQQVVDVVTWRGAYETAVTKGATEREAVRQGDSAVRATQGSFNPEDISAFEAKGPFVRAFSLFYSFFNAWGNRLVTEGSLSRQITRDVGLKAGAQRALFAYLFGFAAPAFVGELIVRAGTGQLPSEDDDDGDVATWVLGAFFGSQARAAASMVPGVGPVATAVAGQFTKEQFDDRVSVSPIVSALDQAVHVPKDWYDVAKTGALEKRQVRDTLTLLTLLSGVPLTPLGRPIGYALDVDQGKTTPKNAADATRGLIVGR